RIRLARPPRGLARRVANREPPAASCPRHLASKRSRSPYAARRLSLRARRAVPSAHFGAVSRSRASRTTANENVANRRVMSGIFWEVGWPGGSLRIAFAGVRARLVARLAAGVTARRLRRPSRRVQSGSSRRLQHGRDCPVNAAVAPTHHGTIIGGAG